jgi:PTH1 family peptidyl-tRNA hydrolase
MILIVGLGNPGKRYQNTRHNIGFRVIDELGSLNEGRVILLKPKTFMNLSGRAVKPLIAKYKIPVANLWVVHDDIDLPLGRIKISKGRGSAGHKGVESIIKELRTKNFVRFRVGIQPKTGKPKNPEKFVLQKLKKDEEKIVKETIEKAVGTIEAAIKKGIVTAMSRTNKK